MAKKILWSLSIFFSLMPSAYAGLEKYTVIDEFDSWVIERKFDPSKDEVACRASMPRYGSWFSARVRLGDQNELLKPEHLITSYKPKPQLMERLIFSLQKCRSSLIYSINE